MDKAEPTEYQLSCQEGIDGLERERLIAALEKQGLRLATRPMEVRRLGEIFLFNRFTPELENRLAQCCRMNPQRVIAIFLGGKGLTAEAALRLLALGAGDVLGWRNPADSVASVSSRLLRWRKVDDALVSPWVRAHLIGQSRTWIAALRQVTEAAMFSRTPILLVGETGTGKEMISGFIHALDPSPGKGALTILDCATLVPGLSGSEFFGHERGAFTHAVSSREGAFAMADGGTLFLDEVGELPLRMQAELLRVVQERTFKKVGGRNWKRVDFRLIAATNRDLDAEIQAGRFRNDLYHRLAGWVVRLPPLRERTEDILPLSAHFAREILGPEANAGFDACVQDYLLTRQYPGNVRELRHLVHLMAARHEGPGPITLGDLPPQVVDDQAENAPGPDSAGVGFKAAIQSALLKGMTLKEISQEVAITAMNLAVKSEGNLQAAASRLGVCKRTLELRRAAARPKRKDDFLREESDLEDALLEAALN